MNPNETDNKWQQFHDEMISSDIESIDTDIIKYLHNINNNLVETKNLLYSIQQDQMTIQNWDKKIDSMWYNIRLIKIILLIPFLITVFLFFVRIFAGYNVLEWLYEFFQLF